MVMQIKLIVVVVILRAILSAFAILSCLTRNKIMLFSGLLCTATGRGEGWAPNPIFPPF